MAHFNYTKPMFTQEELKLMLDCIDVVVKTNGLRTNATVYNLAQKVTKLLTPEEKAKVSKEK